MTNAYDRVYLEKARVSLGRMLDIAVNERGFGLDAFFDLFLGSGLAALFGRGNPSVVVGMSGYELFYAVLEASGLPSERAVVRYATGRSPEYWTGWALAYYQWQSGRSFGQIARVVAPSEVRGLYPAFHEMDVRQFVERMDELMAQADCASPLQRRRLEAGLSQRGLAKLSGVPLRTIQQYEQRQKDIGRAAFGTVDALARALCCAPEDVVSFYG